MYLQKLALSPNKRAISDPKCEPKCAQKLAETLQNALKIQKLKKKFPKKKFDIIHSVTLLKCINFN